MMMPEYTKEDVLSCLQDIRDFSIAYAQENRSNAMLVYMADWIYFGAGLLASILGAISEKTLMDSAGAVSVHCQAIINGVNSSSNEKKKFHRKRRKDK